MQLVSFWKLLYFNILLDFMEERSTITCIRFLIPVRDALDVLSGKWKLQIIVSLILGTKRFSEILKEVEGITAKMLSKELKDLEMNDLVKRKVYDTMPVTVEYSLTEYGKSLENLLNELNAWGVKHREHILSKT